MKHPCKGKEAKIDLTTLREDLQWDRLYGQLDVIGYPNRTRGYECMVCHFKIYAPIFKRHIDYRSLKGAMVNHIKSHFIMGNASTDEG